nr:IS66 family transposase zinc-finger binding domain-containing protein [Hydrogenophaga sp. PBC]
MEGDLKFKQAKIEALNFEIARLKRWRFGSSSESLEASMQAVLFDRILADTALEDRAAQDENQQPSAARRPKGQAVRQALPASLPRIEHHHEIEQTHCACGQAFKRIGQEVSEQLDCVPAQFFVLRHIRGKYACACCQTIQAAPMPAQIIDKGIPAAGLLAQGGGAKHDDHLPLYRQEEIYRRSGVHIARSSMAQWVGNEALQVALHNEFRDDIEQNPGLIPVVTVEAGQSGDQKQGFKGLYRQMLTVMHEHDPDRGAAVVQKDGHLWLNTQGRRTTEGMRNVLESALRQRQTKALVIDEASHLLSMARSASVMDTLKSLANTVGCKVVLIGSFDLLDIIVQSGQVCRRSNIFALQRYKDSPEDRASFKYVVRMLMQAWPCESVPGFDAVSEELREVTFGAVGLLKTLLTNVLTQQLQANGVFSPHMLQSAVKPAALRESIRVELEQGEAKLASAAYGGGAWTDAAFAKMVEKMEG